MNDDVRNIVLGLIAAGISAALGWLARTYLWRRKLRRKQAFFGLPGNSECLLVVNRDAGGDGAGIDATQERRRMRGDEGLHVANCARVA